MRSDVYVVLFCVAYEGESMLDVYGSLQAAQAAVAGAWRPVLCGEAPPYRWTTRPPGLATSSGEWYEIERFPVRR